MSGMLSCCKSSLQSTISLFCQFFLVFVHPPRGSSSCLFFWLPFWTLFPYSNCQTFLFAIWDATWFMNCWIKPIRSLKIYSAKFCIFNSTNSTLTHSSVLAWRIPGTGEPGGLPSMGSHRVRHDWSDLALAVAILPWSHLCPQVGKSWETSIFF